MKVLRAIRVWLATVIDPDMTFRQRRLLAYEQDRMIAHDLDPTL